MTARVTLRKFVPVYQPIAPSSDCDFRLRSHCAMAKAAIPKQRSTTVEGSGTGWVTGTVVNWVTRPTVSEPNAVGLFTSFSWAFV